ncbi:carboxypeptidase-like regulatory domain-containing protein [Paraburkholderia heleia]|uniref:carboxypeptidase-like regulatory domain-containing protein n=1 Tax=Paraburkholderia heleia TaxID=634127 RepID=UPI0006942CB8|nr:carboxypeptidase-like regulatory domain-containing protein [Paraburkholderia heleia]
MKHASMMKPLLTVLALAACTQYAFAATDSLPPVQHQGDIAFLSGGIGLSESTAIKDAMHRYPLTIEFAGTGHSGNVYLANVPVEIYDLHGHTVLKTTAAGPFLLASLPDGQYRVTARYNGKDESREVQISPSAHVHEFYLWSM